VHIPSDVFYTFPTHPLPPHLPASHEQNTTIIAAMVRTAITFAIRGHDVYLDGIVGPWFLPVVVAELTATHVEGHYIVLQAPIETTLARTQQRQDGSDNAVVRQMHSAFATLGVYEAHAIDTIDRTPDLVAAEITRRRAAGTLTFQAS